MCIVETRTEHHLAVGVLQLKEGAQALAEIRAGLKLNLDSRFRPRELVRISDADAGSDLDILEFGGECGREGNE